MQEDKKIELIGSPKINNLSCKEFDIFIESLELQIREFYKDEFINIDKDKPP